MEDARDGHLKSSTRCKPGGVVKEVAIVVEARITGLATGERGNDVTLEGSGRGSGSNVWYKRRRGLWMRLK